MAGVLSAAPVDRRQTGRAGAHALGRSRSRWRCVAHSCDAFQKPQGADCRPGKRGDHDPASAGCDAWRIAVGLPGALQARPHHGANASMEPHLCPRRYCRGGSTRPETDYRHRNRQRWRECRDDRRRAGSCLTAIRPSLHPPQCRDRARRRRAGGAADGADQGYRPCRVASMKAHGRPR